MARRCGVVLAIALAGCGPRIATAPDRAPDGVLAHYLDAVRAGRYAEAYDMMSTAYRKDHDRAGFARTLAEHHDDVDRATARLRKGGATVELRAEARYGDGDVLPLVVDGGVWRIAADPLDFYPQTTPTEALRSFIRAVERKRYDVVFRFVPTKYRKGLSVEELRTRWEGDQQSELGEELAEARAHLTDPIEIAGEEAHLGLGERRQIRLVREDGLWRVEALR